MQTAFTRLRLLPPPAAGTATLAGLNRARARRAANAGILPIVQAIVRQPPRADVLPDLRVGPLEQRADLVEAVLRIPFDSPGRSAAGRLLASHAGDPCSVAGDRTLEGFDLADAAAFAARLEAVIEAVHALARDELLERRGVRVDDPDRAPVAALQLLEKLM